VATHEGSVRTGWLILFRRDETERIAKPVGDYAGLVAGATAFAPEPIVSKDSKRRYDHAYSAC